VATVFSDNRLYRAQSKPNPGAYTFRREKWIEDMMSYRIWNPIAVIANFDDTEAVLTKGSKPEFAVSRCGFYRVLDEVGPHLIQLNPSSIYANRSSLKGALYLN